jgi:hypothetical protein
MSLRFASRCVLTRSFCLSFQDITNGSNMNGSLSTDVSSAAPCQIKAPLVVTISGPPCRGKSLAAHKISRNLFWKGEDVKGEAFYGLCLKSFLLNVEPFSVFKVDDAASIETLKSISEWFKTGHNVAVRKPLIQST